MMPQNNSIITPLNEDQKRAVTTCDCNLLIIAGAGSGKTKTLTHKIAYILSEKLAFPHEILALTFTNKAANEMKERIERLVGHEAKDIWMGTFHSIALRILRIEGFRPTIYDGKDSESLMKEILNRLNIDSKKYPPRLFLNKISSEKLKMIEPADINVSTPFDKLLKKVYETYESELEKAGAVDFDNIILKVVKLLKENKNVRCKYSSRFKYIFIDEYQDTNYPQYLFVRLLYDGNNKVCAVGDEDQSIYSFRGAEIKNIMRFDRDYDNCKIIKLQRNYRSAQEILDIANTLISKNNFRNKKVLYSEKLGGRIEIHALPTEIEEAKFVAEKIIELKEEHKNLSDIAVLYRTNYQSRAIEEVFIRYSIPYKIVGSRKFLERKEIKDVIAYLKLILNKKDNISFLRAIKSHPRGIGEKLIEKIDKRAKDEGLSLFEASELLIREDSLSARQKNSLSEFLEIFYFIDEKKRVDLLIDEVLERSGYKNYLEDNSNSDRMSNVMELKNAGDLSSLESFLEGLSLLDYSDEIGDQDGRVNLMTIHSSKGLEFDSVFVVGLEEGLFPNENLKQTELDIEEERRLLYVAITRAKENLFITYAQARKRGAQYSYTIPSRFLKELKKTRGKAVIKRGDEIEHSVFGKGVVLSVEDNLLTVRFGSEVRRLLYRDRNIIFKNNWR